MRRAYVVVLREDGGVEALAMADLHEGVAVLTSGELMFLPDERATLDGALDAVAQSAEIRSRPLTTSVSVSE